MSDATRPDPATVDTLARIIDPQGWRPVTAPKYARRLLSPVHAPTVAAALAATPNGRQAMLTALGLDQPRHCRNCGWDVTVEP